MEFIIILILAPLLTAIGHFGLMPYLNGTKELNLYTHPTLARAQRILRASNTEKRDAEARRKLRSFQQKTAEIEAEVKEKAQFRLAKTRKVNHDEVVAWNQEFAAITAEEDRLKELERQRKWREAETKRLAQYAAEQRALDLLTAQKSEESRMLAAAIHSRENAEHSLSKHHIGGPYVEEYRHLCVVVHALNVRKLPLTHSRLVDTLTPHMWLTVDGWISYEELYGKSIWYRLANGAGWVWSGGVHTQDTIGLEDLNHWKEPGDSFTQMSATGMVIGEYTSPSHLKSLIDQETRTPWPVLSTGIITTDRISAGQLTGDSVVFNPLAQDASSLLVSESEMAIFKKTRSNF